MRRVLASVLFSCMLLVGLQPATKVGAQATRPIVPAPGGPISAPQEKPAPPGASIREGGTAQRLPLTPAEVARGLKTKPQIARQRTISIPGHARPRAAADDDVADELEAAQVEIVAECFIQNTFQTTTSPDPVVFFSNMVCTIGTPSSMTNTLFQASLDTPRNFFGGNQAPIVTCSGGQSCDSPTYATAFQFSQWLLLQTDFQAIGTDGVIYDLGTLNQAQVFNSREEMYPFIDSTRTDLHDAERFVPGGSNFVPFPDSTQNGPNFWRFCPDFPGVTVPPACPRDPNFNSRLKTVYVNNGWAIPTSTDPARPNPDAHHIQPLKAAGSNNFNDPVMPNGVLLDPVVHDQFTHWWDFWESQTATPSSDGEDD